jgi:hypothetical protein
MSALDRELIEASIARTKQLSLRQGDVTLPKNTYLELCDLALRGLANESAIRTKPPVLERPARVGNTVFSHGVEWSAVIEAAMRAYQDYRRDGKDSAQPDCGVLVPSKIDKYHSYVPPEDGSAGQYYVDGWNDCVDEISKVYPLSAPPEVRTNSPTPRCDDFFGADDYRGAREFARQLERELGELPK